MIGTSAGNAFDTPSNASTNGACKQIHKTRIAQSNRPHESKKRNYSPTNPRRTSRVTTFERGVPTRRPWTSPAHRHTATPPRALGRSARPGPNLRSPWIDWTDWTYWRNERTSLESHRRFREGNVRKPWRRGHDSAPSPGPTNPSIVQRATNPSFPGSPPPRSAPRLEPGNRRRGGYRTTLLKNTTSV